MWIRIIKRQASFDIKSENQEEQIATKLAEKIMNIASMASAEADINGYNDSMEQMIDIEKNAIKPFVIENKDAIKDVYELIYMHLQDNNFHTTNEALAQVLNIK